MKHVLLAIVAVLLTSCSTSPTIQPQKIVTVVKPVPVVPTPPSVPECELLVRQLTPLSAENPGLVGQAYKHDMLCLITRDQQMRQILAVYTELSKKSDLTTQQINEAFAAINK